MMSDDPGSATGDGGQRGPFDGIFFVVPRATIDRNRGGGQRTFATFTALKAAGPVTVVIVGHQPVDEEWIDFPGARETIVLRDIDLSEEGYGRITRVLLFVEKYFFPSFFYRTNARLRERLKRIIGEGGRRLVVFRLFPVFGKSGLRTDANGPAIIVDVDDRDDQKAEARLRALFGTAVPRWLVERFCIGPLRAILTRSLRGASEAWFAAGEDVGLAGVRSRVIENGAFAARDGQLLAAPSASADILFLGPAFFQPNVAGVRWFLQECWPLILGRLPAARFRIVGGGDWHGHLEGVAGAANIDVKGFVPDIAAEYNSSRLAICPSKEGGGSKVKLIEACAFGRPVVATAHSMRGFSAALTDAIIGADAAGDFAAGCMSLLEDPALADARGSALKSSYEQLYSAKAFSRKVADALTSI